MSDEPEVEALHFTSRVVKTVERWPARISIDPDWFRHPHVDKATVDGDTVTFAADNGTGVYRLRHDLPRHGRAIVADLVEGDTPGKLRQAAKKYTGGA